MYNEDQLLPISALQHIIHCRRRCALIYIEQCWDENQFTAEGQIIHTRVHQQDNESRGDMKISRGIQIRSFRHGLYGVADVVEFHRVEENGIPLPNAEGLWAPLPIEYKRGKAKDHKPFAIQLCAQALCIEEMLGAQIPRGVLYYGMTRKKLEISFDDPIRNRTADAAQQLHQLIQSGHTPDPEYGPKCRSCSLNNQCLPRSIRNRKASDYLRRRIEELEDTQ